MKLSMQSLHISTLNHWHKNPDDSCHWLSRARAVTGWGTTRPLLFKGKRYPIIVKGVTAPCFFFFFFFILRNYCNSTLLWPTWMNLMTYELNVDKFYAQLGVFFYFCYFTEGWNLDQIESHDQGFSCWQILRPIGRFFLFSLFHLIEG